MKPFVFLLGITLLLAECTRKEVTSFETYIGDDRVVVSLEQVSDSIYRLVLDLNGVRHSQWSLRYPVFSFDYGDVTNNGITDIGVGVIKGTRFFPEPDKRPFLFQITEEFDIRPLWLGSRVSQPLECFRLVRTEVPAIIRTIEKEKDGKFLVAEYRWNGFGIEFIHYLNRDLSLNKAEKLLQSNL